MADAVVDPLCAQAVLEAAELLRSLGHEVEEVDPPWQLEGPSELFGVVFSIHIALSIASSGRVAGREPTAQDMEPMSWAIFSMIKKLSAVEGAGVVVQLQRIARRLVSFLAPYDALLTPALAERPLPLGTLDTAAPDPMATFTRSGLFTPFTALFNASGQPASRCRCSRARTDCRWACRSSGAPPARATCSRSPRSSKRRSRGPSGERPLAHGVLD